MTNTTTTESARTKDILFAASRLARTGGTFTTARVVRVLGVYGYEVRSLDVAERIETVLLASGEYCTDELGTFASI